MEEKENYKLGAGIALFLAIAAAHEMVAIYSNFYGVNMETRLKMSLYHGLAWYTCCVFVACVCYVKYKQNPKAAIKPKIKPNTLVKFDFQQIPEKRWKDYRHNFTGDEKFIYMGEIEQIPGRCIVCGYESGKINCVFETKYFIPLA